MNIKASDIRRGQIVTIDGTNYLVMDFAHRTPGNLRAFVQAKLRNLSNNSQVEKRFRSDEPIEVPFVEHREFEYLYSSDDEHVFMDVETYDQIHLGSDMVGDSMPYLLPNSRVQVTYIDQKPTSIELPATVDLTVTDTPPSIKGATATNQYKEATTETGLKVMVPPFVEPGDKVRIDTRSGEYVSRV
ncbi:MAG: elongation factor P [Isosphaeraceae bacterium]|jgi:elongation factor P|nr:MAG: elongation factor P [Isosphaeraceae bacterium]